jgi:hypothetical protein
LLNSGSTRGKRHDAGRSDRLDGTTLIVRILRLALLAPDIVEAILAGKTDQALMLEQLEQPLPGSWEEQRRGLGIGGSYDRG